MFFKVRELMEMGWKGVDIMSNGNVHHIKYGEDIRKVVKGNKR